MDQDESLPDRAKVAVDLSRSERQLLMAGLAQWLGPAKPTNELAVALGSSDVADLRSEVKRLRELLANEQALSDVDWLRALAATEIVFASDVFGAGYDWATCTGLRDADTIVALRGLQRRLVSVYAPARTKIRVPRGRR